MTDVLPNQPDLFGQMPQEPVDIDVQRAAYAAKAVLGARSNPLIEQDIRDQKIYEGRGEDLSGESKGRSIAPAPDIQKSPVEHAEDASPQPKPDGHDAFIPVTDQARALGLPTVKAIRETLSK